MVITVGDNKRDENNKENQKEEQGMKCKSF